MVELGVGVAGVDLERGWLNERWQSPSVGVGMSSFLRNQGRKRRASASRHPRARNSLATILDFAAGRGAEGRDMRRSRSRAGSCDEEH